MKLEEFKAGEYKNGILIETTGYSRNQSFAFQRYIDMFLKED